MKITSKGQVTIPPAMRRKHGLLPRREIEVVDQPNGVLEGEDLQACLEFDAQSLKLKSRHLVLT